MSIAVLQPLVAKSTSMGAAKCSRAGPRGNTSPRKFLLYLLCVPDKLAVSMYPVGSGICCCCWFGLLGSFVVVVCWLHCLCGKLCRGHGCHSGVWHAGCFLLGLLCVECI